MGLIRNVALFVLTISFFTFVAFFGRLPGLRNTPIGFLHRVLWIHMPSGFRRVDTQVTGGRLTDIVSRTVDYLLNDKHPVIVIFFLGLITISATMFLSKAWPHMSLHNQVTLCIFLPMPYIFTYLSASTSANPNLTITDSNHHEQMGLYPYDRILYHPGLTCRTCQFVKPARSKHCRICKACIARADHHCVWVNNCLGRGNYRWFLALLLSTGVLIAYGTYLAYIIISPQVTKQWDFIAAEDAQPAPSATVIAAVQSRFEALTKLLTLAVRVGGIRIGAVGLLALMTWPLPLGLLGYHVYLIWAGMTTNESAKWADWRDEMYDGAVFLGRQKSKSIDDHDVPHTVKAPAAGTEEPVEYANQPEVQGADEVLQSREPGPGSTRGRIMLQTELEPPTSWPVRSRQVLVRTADGQPPRTMSADLRAVMAPNSWERCWRLAQIENIYDLGFWDNLKEAFT